MVSKKQQGEAAVQASGQAKSGMLATYNSCEVVGMAGSTQYEECDRPIGCSYRLPWLCPVSQVVLALFLTNTLYVPRT